MHWVFSLQIATALQRPVVIMVWEALWGLGHQTRSRKRVLFGCLLRQTPVSFEDWDVNQPNSDDYQDCLGYLHGPKKWHGVNCNLYIEIFVCECWWNMHNMPIESWDYVLKYSRSLLGIDYLNNNNISIWWCIHSLHLSQYMYTS